MAISTGLVTPFYAALAVVLYIGLSVRTLLLRRSVGVAIGTGDDPVLARAIRAHANCAEYLPMALLLLLMAEVAGLGAASVHSLGAILLFGRMLHAYGISKTKEDFRFRVAGMAMTFTVLISTTLSILWSHWNMSTP